MLTEDMDALQKGPQATEVCIYLHCSSILIRDGMYVCHFFSHQSECECST